MYGAIIGDLAGSIYEFDQINKIQSIKIDNIIEDNAFYSDDTILTISILDAIINDKNYEKYLKQYINNYKNYKPDFEPYFASSFSPRTIRWVSSNTQGNSSENGAMMRVSPIGYMFNTEEEVIKNALLSTIPSHNSIESINCATIVALMIFYFRKKMSKEDVFDKLNIIPEYSEFNRFNVTCGQTINNCLYTIYNSNSFEESIRNIIMMGGDTDTNACIVGSIAESIYGIDNSLIEQAN